MRLRHELRVTVREWLAAGSVDSRWWYWVAAIPAAFALWTLAVSWAAVAIAAGPLAAASPVPRAVEVSLVVFTVPFVVLVVMAPVAVLADVAAIRAADVGWTPDATRLAGLVAIAPLVLGGGVALDWLADGVIDAPHWAVLAGFLVAVPAAAYYLSRRHAALGVP